jgi:hypothetical protein
MYTTMISSQDTDIKSLVATLARTLSPKGKCRRNDIARQWAFEDSNWVAEEVYSRGDDKTPIGVKLSSPEFDGQTTGVIEYALALLMGQRALVSDCILVDEQRWGEEYNYKRYDCGYERTYRLKDDELRIIIRHQGNDRVGHTKSTAAASLRRNGSMIWRNICKLQGSRIRSREEVQYREQPDFHKPSNAHLFRADERELFQMAMEFLKIT